MPSSSERAARGVVLFAAVDWNFLKQRVHHLATGFAAAGLKVLFVENTGVRAPNVRDIPRILERLRSALAGTARMTKELLPEKVQVFSPLALPFPYRRWAVAYNLRLLRRAVIRFLIEHDLIPQETVLFSYLPTPLVLQLAECFPWKKVVYDVLSDPKEVEPRTAPFEQELLQRADVTLFASATLYEQYREHTLNPLLFRDGFNVELLEVNEAVPPEIATLPRPRILYLGGINRKLWVEAIEALSRAFSTGSILLVGPVARGEVRLPNAPNVYWFPPRPRYEELAGILRAADVALIPYRPDQYTGAMHPAKLNEYLVFGLPVVATATPEVRQLAQEWPEKTIYLAEKLDEFREAATSALAEDNMELRRTRQDIAGNNTWKKRVKSLLALLDRSVENV